MSKEKNNNIEKKEVVETLKSDYEKSFDEIMDEILSDENGENKMSASEEFEKNMEEIKKLKVDEFAESCVEEVENTQVYKFSSSAHIKLFNGSVMDMGFGEGYRERTLLQTSSGLLIDGTFNTSEIVIEKYPSSFKIGKVVFKNLQKTDTLIMGNVGVCGEFIAQIVSINDNSYVDIALDVTDRTKCTYLLIDTRFDKVCGNIKMTEQFYNQMTECNKKYLLSLSDNKHIKITVEDTAFEEYNIPLNRIAEFTYDELLRDLQLDYKRL